MSRRSLLQGQILLHLLADQPQSAARLARSLERQRPSISRSLKTLEGDSLVARGKKGWILTENGREEADRVMVRLTEAVSSAQQIAVTVSGIDQFRALDLPRMPSLSDLVPPEFAGGLSKALAGNWTKDLQKVMAVPSLDRLFGADWAKNVAEISQVSKSVVDMLTPSVTAVLEVQGAYTDILRQFSQAATFSLDIQNIVASSNIFTNEALRNIGAVGLAVSNLGLHLDDLLYAGATDHLDAVGESYRAFTASALGRLELSALTPSLIQRDVAIPSLTFASYTGSLRGAIVDEVGLDSSLTQEGGEDGIEPELDILLRRLNPDYEGMRKGSWQALRSTNPDRFRHAAVSHRELILHVLRHLVPDAPLEEGKPGSTMKARVKTLMGGSEKSADLAVDVARAVCSLYDYMNKVTHTNVREEQAVKAALITGEGLLLFLLSHCDFLEA